MTPPEFSGTNALSALEIGEDFLDLQWSLATDNVAVVRYRISLNGVLHQVVSGEQNRLLIDGLAPGVNTSLKCTVRMKRVIAR